MPESLHTPRLAVIGGGPAGLMAAEAGRAAGVQVDVYEAKGSVGRKFLVAGKGGLNLTHSERRPGFDARYGTRRDWVATWLDAFDPDALRDWARALGVETYVGSSGRVFPMDRKAAPLLRTWVRRLRESGVQFHMHHRWLGWGDNGTHRFDTPAGHVVVAADASILALGGGSWPQLGSDGAWVPVLRERLKQLDQDFGFDPKGHSGKALRHAVASLPRDLLITIDYQAMRDLVMMAMSLADRPRPAAGPLRAARPGHVRRAASRKRLPALATRRADVGCPTPVDAFPVRVARRRRDDPRRTAFQ